MEEKKITTTLKFCSHDWNAGATKGKIVRGTWRGRDKIRKSFWTRQAHRFEMLGRHPRGGFKEAAGCQCVGCGIQGTRLTADQNSGGKRGCENHFIEQHR